MTYEKAGVDVKEGQRAVELMKQHVRKTFNSQVLEDIGGFGGLFALNLKGIVEPVLVAGTDGVGTKLKIAFLMDKHDTIGQDCVAMCVNDILCQGAQPLFFLDYIATGRLKAQKIAEIVKGVAQACQRAGCALIGGETAEMPGFYQEGEYDIAGFAVGIVDKGKIINGKAIEEGDMVIGLSSSGLHSNGFSLVRKILLEEEKLSLDEFIPQLNRTLGEELMTPTKIYVKPVMELINTVKVKAIGHITGGGFYENIPRILPEGFEVQIQLGTWPIPHIFQLLQKLGNIHEEEMYKTFNMGIGMVLVVSKDDLQKSLEVLKQSGEEAYVIGKIQKGEKQVVLWRE